MGLHGHRHSVLFVHSGGNWLAGSERSLLLLIDELRARGVSCSVLCNNPVMADACRAQSAPAGLYRRDLFLLPSGDPALNPLPFLRSVSAIRRFAKRHHATIMHANNVHPTQAAFMAARTLGIPIVAHVRGAGFLRSSRYASCLRWCDAVICVSQAVARDYWPDKLKDRLQVIYNGVRLPDGRGASGQALRAVLLGDADYLIGTASFLRPEKSLEDFVRLGAHARRFGKRCRLVVAGDGEERARLTNMIRAEALSDVVVLLGYVEDMASFLGALDVFVLTSRFDALPRSLIQAAAAGLPSVATRVGGIPEIVDDGQTGFLVPAGDAAGMWERVSALLDGPALAESMGQAARDRARERFSAGRYAEQVIEVYDGLGR